jgi:hypothetical protein
VRSPTGLGGAAARGRHGPPPPPRARAPNPPFKSRLAQAPPVEKTWSLLFRPCTVYCALGRMSSVPASSRPQVPSQVYLVLWEIGALRGPPRSAAGIIMIHGHRRPGGLSASAKWTEVEVLCKTRNFVTSTSMLKKGNARPAGAFKVYAGALSTVVCSIGAGPRPARTFPWRLCLHPARCGAFSWGSQ